MYYNWLKSLKTIVIRLYNCIIYIVLLGIWSLTKFIAHLIVLDFTSYKNCFKLLLDILQKYATENLNSANLMFLK